MINNCTEYFILKIWLFCDFLNGSTCSVQLRKVSFTNVDVQRGVNLLLKQL